MRSTTPNLFIWRNGLRVPLTARGTLPAYHCHCCGFLRCAAIWPRETAALSARLGRTGVLVVL